MESIYRDHFSYIVLVDLMRDDEQWALHSLGQQSHIILTLLCMTDFADLSNYCHFHYLVDLVDLNRVRSLNQGVPAYYNRYLWNATRRA